MSTVEPTWLASARAQAEASFVRLGLPRTDDESWHYTSLSPWASRLTAPARGVSAQQTAQAIELLARAPAIDGPRLVFVDGRYAPELSSATGAPMEALSVAVPREAASPVGVLGALADAPANGLVALNAARFSDGALVRVPRRATLERPLVLVFVATDAATSSDTSTTHVRTRVELAADARAHVVEVHLGGAGSSTSSVTDVVVGPGAELHYTRVHDEPDTAVHLGRVEVRHHEHSRFHGASLILAGKLQRVELVAHLAERAECHLDGFSLAHHDHVADQYTLVVHGTNHGTSRQTYKAIAADKAVSTFYGKVQVLPGTAGNDARQSSKNLLLSAGATAHTRPQLEIDAEDVQCSHGATVGRLDPQQVFYLLSRGIAEADARAMLVAAFAGEVLEHIATEAVRAALAPRVAERIGAVAGGTQA